jgi:DNA-damage-inducible protein J
MGADTTISVRVDSKTKEEARLILEHLDMSLTEAITVYLKQIIYHRGIPFELRIPNEVSLRALREAERGEGLKSADTADELFEELDR